MKQISTFSVVRWSLLVQNQPRAAAPKPPVRDVFSQGWSWLHSILVKKMIVTVVFRGILLPQVINSRFTKGMLVAASLIVTSAIWNSVLCYTHIHFCSCSECPSVFSYIFTLFYCTFPGQCYIFISCHGNVRKPLFPMSSEEIKMEHWADLS